MKDPVTGLAASTLLFPLRTILIVYEYSTPKVRLQNLTMCCEEVSVKLLIATNTSAGMSEERITSSSGDSENMRVTE